MSILNRFQILILILLFIGCSDGSIRLTPSNQNIIITTESNSTQNNSHIIYKCIDCKKTENKWIEVFISNKSIDSVFSWANDPQTKKEIKLIDQQVSGEDIIVITGKFYFNDNNLNFDFSLYEDRLTVIDGFGNSIEYEYNSYTF